MQDQAIHFVQVSDIHLFGDAKKSLLGVNTQESLNAILKLIKQEKNLDFILLTGDLSQDGSEASYHRLADELLEFKVPAYFLPGNHDDSDVLKRVYPRDPIQNDKHLVFDKWQIILLDSHIQGKVEGRFTKQQLQFLENCLQTHTKQHAIITFHHQPVDIGCKWLDPLGLTNAKDFWQMVQKYPHVHSVLFGHIHQQFEQQIGKIKIYSAPATCFQFKGHQAEFGLEKLPPGIRKVTLHSDGRLNTEVVRVPHYVGYFDASAKGY